jgi:ankyrin repeat protein
MQKDLQILLTPKAWKPKNIEKLSEYLSNPALYTQLKELRDENGNTILHMAAQYVDRQMIQSIIDNIGNKDIAWINIKNNNGQTALVTALFSKNAFKDGAIEILLERGADPHSIDTFGNSVLSYAAADGTPNIIELMVKKYKVDVNSSNKFSRSASPLISAILEHKRDNVKKLLELQADPNSMWRSKSALYIALEEIKPYTNEGIDLACALLQHGANPDLELTGQFHKTAREYWQRFKLEDQLEKCIPVNVGTEIELEYKLITLSQDLHALTATLGVK